MRGFVSVVAAVLGVMACVAVAGGRTGVPSDADVRAAFAAAGHPHRRRRRPPAIRADVGLALDEARAHGIGNSKVDFAAVEIASRLGLDTSPGSNTVRNVVAAIRRARPATRRREPRPRAAAALARMEALLRPHAGPVERRVVPAPGPAEGLLTR